MLSKLPHFAASLLRCEVEDPFLCRSQGGWNRSPHTGGLAYPGIPTLLGPWGTQCGRFALFRTKLNPLLACITLASPFDLIFLPRGQHWPHPFPFRDICCISSFHGYLSDAHYFTSGPMLGTKVSTENKIKMIPELLQSSEPSRGETLNKV